MSACLPRYRFTSTRARQRGATLIVGLVLMALLSILALYGAGSEMLDLRTAGNEYRGREAMAAAEFGAEQGVAYIRTNWDNLDPQGWTACTSSSTLPCGAISNDRTAWRHTTLSSNIASPTNGTSYNLHLLGLPNTDSSYRNLFMIVVEGHSADGTGHVVLRQAIQSYPVGGATAAAPLIAAGAVSLGGNIHVFANHDGTSPPLSVWSNSNVGGGGSPNTYYPKYFDKDCDGTDDYVNSSPDGLTTSSTENIDILDVDSNVGKNPDSTDFPSDIFQYLFGTPGSNYASIRDIAASMPGHLLTSCAGLGPSSSGLYWIAGNCDPSGTIGSANAPVMLVVQGTMKLNGNGTIWGLLFNFCTAPGFTAACGITQANGNMIVRGAIIADTATNITSGSFEAHYDRCALSKIGDISTGRGIAKLPASWVNWTN